VYIYINGSDTQRAVSRNKRWYLYTCIHEIRTRNARADYFTIFFLLVLSVGRTPLFGFTRESRNNAPRRAVGAVEVDYTARHPENTAGDNTHTTIEEIRDPLSPKNISNIRVRARVSVRRASYTPKTGTVQRARE